jgi:hypothetical protein
VELDDHLEVRDRLEDVVLEGDVDLLVRSEISRTWKTRCGWKT